MTPEKFGFKFYNDCFRKLLSIRYYWNSTNLKPEKSAKFDLAYNVRRRKDGDGVKNKIFKSKNLNRKGCEVYYVKKYNIFNL